MDSIITYIIAPILTAFAAYLFGRRMSNAEAKRIELTAVAEAKKMELDNVDEMIRMWRETAESYREKFTASDKVVEELRDLMLTYKNQHAEVLEKLTALEKDYSSLNRKYNDLKKLVR